MGVRARRYRNLILSLGILALMVTAAGCGEAGASTTPALNLKQASIEARPEQFLTIAKDGVEIACPKGWQTYSTDPSLVYGVSRTDTIRIVIGVLPAAEPGYYEILAANTAVQRTTIAGYPAYRSDFTYYWSSHQVTNICLTVIKADKACHIMVLCETELLEAFMPTFEYVFSSLKFQ